MNSYGDFVLSVVKELAINEDILVSVSGNLNGIPILVLDFTKATIVDVEMFLDRSARFADKVIFVAVKNYDLIPEIAHNGDSNAFDLKANILNKEFVELNPGERYLFKNGIRLAMPTQVMFQVVPRSGLALKHGITVLNTPGIVDWAYRNEVGTVLINHGDKPFKVESGMRISQGFFLSPMGNADIWAILFLIGEQFFLIGSEDDVFLKYFPTERALKGFGSSGV